MPFVNCDGTRIHWREDGPADAAPLVMVGSLGSDHRVWEPVLPGLARAFRVIRIDARGHGASDAPPGDYTMELLGSDVLAVADAAGATRFHYVGLSIGGMIGMWLATHHPERLERLVLSNTTATVDPASQRDRIAAVRAGGMAQVVDPVLARWFTPEYAQKQTDHYTMTRLTLASIDPVGYTGCCAAIRDMRVEALLPGVRVPTLVIVGSVDPSTPPEHGRRIAAAIPGARCLELPTAHLSQSEQPERFVDEVTRFLQGG